MKFGKVIGTVRKGFDSADNFYLRSGEKGKINPTELFLS